MFWAISDLTSIADKATLLLKETGFPSLRAVTTIDSIPLTIGPSIRL